MKKIFLILLVFCWSAASSSAQDKSKGQVNQQIDNVVKKIVAAYQQIESAKYRNTLAVPDFENKSRDAEEKEVGFGASELLTTRLSQTGFFQIVERKRLKDVMQEVALGQTGAVSEASAVEAGKLLGADIIVIGSVSELGNYYNLNVRLIEVETGRILVSTVEEIEKEMMISSIGYVAPKRYRIGIGFYLEGHNDDVGAWQKGDREDGSGPFGFTPFGQEEESEPFYKDPESSLRLVVEYSRDLGKRFFIDIEGGVNWQTTKTASFGVSPFPEHWITERFSLHLTSRLNYWLWNRRTLGLSLFAGFGGLYKDHAYDAAWGHHFAESDGDNINTIFPVVPAGISFYMFQISLVSLRFDVGYQTSLKKTIWAFPFDMPDKPPDLVMDPSGIISAVKVRMYF